MRDFANTSIKAGLTIDEIKTNPVALALAARMQQAKMSKGLLSTKTKGLLQRVRNATNIKR